MLRRPTLVTVAIALVVTLTACTESARIPDAEPSSEGAPLFASDEEALAAATAAYQEYLAVSERIAANPPFALDELKPLATAEFLSRESELFDSLAAEGWRISGRTALVASELQQWFEDPEFGYVVIFYGCLDVSATRLLDEDGIDVTPEGRTAATSIEVEMVGTEMSGLLLNRSDSWLGESLC